jgi:hypothetical protein
MASRGYREICSALGHWPAVVLEKHASDFSKYYRVVFRKSDFIEKVALISLKLN